MSPQGPPNPFFGTRVIKKTPPVHVKDDFNPFKHHKVIEAAQVGACAAVALTAACHWDADSHFVHAHI